MCLGNNIKIKGKLLVWQIVGVDPIYDYLILIYFDLLNNLRLVWDNDLPLAFKADHKVALWSFTKVLNYAEGLLL